ncbi:MATE family efflux transporter [Roseibium sp.]|uniref:MATE family efflux transporter n=1 Tax=Roseibium sp. TaxID=1936156 RepID=UPI0039F09162
MNNTIFLSVFDQLLVSGSMFLLNLLLISMSGMESYGHFVLVFSLSLIAFGAQNAIVLMPLNVLLPGERENRKPLTIRMLATLDLAVLSAMCLLVGGLAFAFGVPRELCLAAVLLVLTNGMRELQRSLFLTRQQPFHLLRLDGAAVIAGTLALIIGLQLTEPPLAGLLAIAAGNLVSVILYAQPVYRSPRRLGQMMRLYAPYWAKSRWALGGAALTEAHLRLYVFIVELAKGSAALGLLQTGRVLVNPVSLIAFGWARASRPLIAQKIADGDHSGAKKVVYVGTALLLTIGVLYIAALNLGWPYLAVVMELDGAGALHELIAAWSLFAIAGVPSICLSVYLQATHRYRALTIAMAYSVALSSAFLLLLFTDFGLSWAIWALIAGEVVLFVAISMGLRPQGRPLEEKSA